MSPPASIRAMFGLLVAALVVAGFANLAQCQNPEAPTLPEAPSHRFFDKSNKVRLSILGGLVAADGITTHNVISHHYGTEVNPLARPLVMQGGAGQAAASVLGYGASVGTSYLLHRTGHHKLERWMLHVGMAVEVECITNNLVQSATAPSARLPRSASGTPARNLGSRSAPH